MILVRTDHRCLGVGRHNYALVDTKSHASKYFKVTMSKLLGGVMSIVSINLDRP
jgi:hypothetical protein